MSEARTITQTEYLELTFEPTKADGSRATVDHGDHHPAWVADGTPLELNVYTELGLAKFRPSADGMTCSVYPNAPGGGLQSYAITVNGDADLDVGEVRDVQWSLTLDLIVLADEASEGGGTVSDPLPIPA